jgi:hypothetical protein
LLIAVSAIQCPGLNAAEASIAFTSHTTRMHDAPCHVEKERERERGGEFGGVRKVARKVERLTPI